MNCIAACLAVGLSGLAAAPSDLVVGGSRPVAVHVPPSYQPGVPMPLLIALHGFGSSGETNESYMRLQPVCTARGLLYAAPDGTVDCAGNRFWNGSDCCNVCERDVDDAAYLAGVIAEIRNALSVDARRIYLAGHSNGGFMSYDMACRHSETIAALASLAGAASWDSARCLPVVGVHVLQIHGTADELVHYGGGTLAEYFGLADPSAMPYLGAIASVEQWARLDGCDSAAAFGPRLDLDQSIAGSETAAARYLSGCRDDGSADLWSIQGGFHEPDLGPRFAENVVDWLLKHPKGRPTRAGVDLVPASGAPPLEVSLDGSGSRSVEGTKITAYRWDFGDGSSGAGRTASHIYTGPGRYLASLTITTDAGQVDTTGRPVTVLCPSGDVAPWIATDIGGPVYSGSVQRKAGDGGGVLEICAGGAGFGSLDSLLLVARKIEGDFRLTARIVEVTSGAAGAFVGLTFREESASAGARFGAVGFDQEARADRKGTFRFRYRPRNGSSPTVRNGTGVPSFPCWLRLERSGTTIRGFSSLNGRTWALVGQTAIEGLQPALLAGVAAHGQDTGNFPFAPLRATVSGPEVERRASFIRGACNDDGLVDLSDAICILLWLFLGSEAPKCLAAADANGDRQIDVSDAVALVEFLFLDGPQPPEPFAACGPDASADGLPCEEFKPCQ